MWCNQTSVLDCIFASSCLVVLWIGGAETLSNIITIVVDSPSLPRLHSLPPLDDWRFGCPLNSLQKALLNIFAATVIIVVFVSLTGGADAH